MPTIAAPRKTSATKLVPVAVDGSSSKAKTGTSIAPIRPKPATISDDQLSDSATATAAIPAASARATSGGISSYRAAAKSSVA
jgi:hypothetical protein